MSAQPKYTPLQQSDFFGDGRSARPLEEGTVARGRLRDDPGLYDGLDDGPAPPGRIAALVGLGANPLTAAPLAPYANADATVLPFEVTEADMERGRDRYNIYCSVCHDRVGTGHGKVVERGYLRPPSYHTARLRAAPVGHFYRVVTEGFGGMPDYREQIPPRDRWLIVAYVRALQLSQSPAPAGGKEGP
jgi:mono/diheme cytochrome c family protein